MLSEEFWDEDFGRVIIVRSSRAKRVIARRRSDAIWLTVPGFYSMSQIMPLFNTLKPRLHKLNPVAKLFFDENTVLDTLTFRLEIKRADVQNFYANLKDGVLHFICPLSADFSEEGIQDKIKSYLEAALRSEAKRIIPPKTETLARKFGFTFSEVKINKSRTRWGSCSSRKSVNISLYCLFLPEYLLDFIILHELSHTKEMNHSGRFWELLNSVTANRAGQLTKELKSVKIPI